MNTNALTDFALRRPVTIVMLTICMTGLGMIAWFSIPLMFMPRFDSPFLFCSIPYPGASPRQVEQQIAIPAEGEFRTVPGVSQIRTISDGGGCFITMMFDLEVDMGVASADVRDRIERLKLKLPSEAENVLIQRFSTQTLPVMALGVFSSGDPHEFVHRVRTVLSPRLSRLDGVADIRIMTQIDEEEILVEFNQDVLRSMNLGLAPLVAALQQSSMNVSVGQLSDGINENFVRLVGEYRSIEDLENIVVTPNGIRLKDVASVTSKTRTFEAKASLDGKGGAFLMITKESEANTVETCDAIQKELLSIMSEPTFEGTDHKVFFNQSEMITSALDSLFQEGIYGALMAIVILIIFMHRLLPIMIVTLTIPGSLVVAFVFMYFLGMTLNLVTMVSLIIVVGMLVDNSIVVVENVVRHRQLGLNEYDSARIGTSEVGMAVIAQTATTLVVFLPMFYLEAGEMSVIMRELGYPLLIALAASLVLTLTLIPLAMSRIKMRREANLFKVLETRFKGEAESHTFLSKVFLFVSHIRPIDWVISLYGYILARSLRNRLASLFVIVAMMYVTYMIPFQAMGMRDMPKMDARQVKVQITTDQDVTFEETQRLFDLAENTIREHTDIGIANILTFYELGGGEISLFLKTEEDGPEWASPKYSTEDVMKMVSAWVPASFAGADVHILMPEAEVPGGGEGGGISLSLRGEDRDLLEEMAARFKLVMGQVPNLVDVSTDVEESKDEIQIKIDEPLASRAGITPYMIANTVDAALRGARLPYMKKQGREISVWAQFREEDRKSKANLDNVAIASPVIGTLIPLSQLVDDVKGFTPTAIHRVNGKNVVTLHGRTETTNMAQIAQDLQKATENFTLPPGYNFKIGQTLEKLGENLVNFTSTFLMAIILIYLVMSALFESFLLPFSILTSVPLSLVGAVWVLYFTNTEMDTVIFIGCVLMSGIIVGNGIIIVDHVNTLRKEIPDRTAAVVLAGEHRFRPVMMTTLTGIFGLVPLALSTTGGAATFAGLAIALIGGSTVGTLLTLVVVPLFYTIIEDARDWFFDYIASLLKLGGAKS